MTPTAGCAPWDLWDLKLTDYKDKICILCHNRNFFIDMHALQRNQKIYVLYWSLSKVNKFFYAIPQHVKNECRSDKTDWFWYMTFLKCCCKHFTALKYITHHYTALHCNTLHYTALHCTKLHLTTQHCITLPYTILHQADKNFLAASAHNIGFYLQCYVM